MIRIAHLSDFHFEKNNIKDVKHLLQKALIDDLSMYHSEKEIDMIIISGDLVHKGGSGFKDIEEALFEFTFNIIDPVINELNLSKEKVFFVPGNHDVVRGLDSKYVEEGLVKKLISIEAVNEYFDENTFEGRERIKPFKDFEKYFYGSNENYKITDFQSNSVININDYNVGITCFNTSWRCYNSIEDKNKLILGERQILDSREHIVDCDLKIGVMHHSLDWIADFEKSNVSSMLSKDYDLILCGHIHEGGSWTNTNMYGSDFISIAPANGTFNLRSNDKTYSTGYSIIDYNDSNSEISVHNRRYSYLQKRFVANTDLGNDQGVGKFKLPTSEEVLKNQTETDLSEKIFNTYSEIMNKDLLSHNTDTYAPKNIKDMFVLPDLVANYQYDMEKKDTEVVYDLTKLCASENHIIITGGKESGKTILLDRILLELSNNINGYSKLPVYIDLSELKNLNRVETLISRFWTIGIHDVSEILNDQKVVLLIDNVEFSQSQKMTLKKIENFIEHYPNVTVIATTNTIFENQVPLEIHDYPIVSKFEQVKIENFKTKQIKELIRNWFSQNDHYDNPEKFDKLLGVFSSLNIPRTPLAVSMFLWIIEHQENYKPINNATMLENFIEKLFRKHSGNEIYSERFDYRNKERLLAEIAYEMYRHGKKNYSLIFKDLKDLVYKHLRIRKFGFQEDDVLKEFIDNGILVQENDISETYIRFRFTCFFKYFLMKNMEFNEKFKEYVLNEENYLYFTDEIDYFTGIKRDQSEILKTVVDRMENEYDEMLKKIQTLEKGFDTVFETQYSITSSLDENFVKELTEKGKPSEQEIEKINDGVLENIKPETGIKKIETEISPVQRLERLWTLSARVLKNTEETEIENLKSNSYKSIVKSSMVFASIYKVILMDFIRKNKEEGSSEQIDEKTLILNKFLPLAHQSLLHTLMGTGKLSLVILESIEENFVRDDTSDFEKFISVFLYSDLKEKEYMRYLNKLVKNTNSKYIRDMIFFKVITYYFLRSKNKEMDNIFENIIGDIIIKSKGLPSERKSKVILDYRQKRKQKTDDEFLLDA